MRTREAQQLDEELGVAMRAFHGTKRDRSMWASIAWRVGVEAFHFALMDKLAEDAADDTRNIRSRVPGIPQRPLPEEGRCGMTMEGIRMMEPPYTREQVEMVGRQ